MRIAKEFVAKFLAEIADGAPYYVHQIGVGSIYISVPNPGWTEDNGKERNWVLDVRGNI